MRCERKTEKSLEYEYEKPHWPWQRRTPPHGGAEGSVAWVDRRESRELKRFEQKNPRNPTNKPTNKQTNENPNKTRFNWEKWTQTHLGKIILNKYTQLQKTKENRTCKAWDRSERRQRIPSEWQGDLAALHGPRSPFGVFCAVCPVRKRWQRTSCPSYLTEWASPCICEQTTQSTFWAVWVRTCGRNGSIVSSQTIITEICLEQPVILEPKGLYLITTVQTTCSAWFKHFTYLTKFLNLTNLLPK